MRKKVKRKKKHHLNRLKTRKAARIQQASAKLRNVFVKALLWC